MLWFLLLSGSPRLVPLYSLSSLRYFSPPLLYPFIKTFFFLPQHHSVSSSSSPLLFFFFIYFLLSLCRTIETEMALRGTESLRPQRHTDTQGEAAKHTYIFITCKCYRTKMCFFYSLYTSVEQDFFFSGGFFFQCAAASSFILLCWHTAEGSFKKKKHKVIWQKKVKSGSTSAAWKYNLPTATLC